MKRSDLNKFIKENIIETLSESSSSEEKRIALRAVNSIAKYRDVSHEEAKQDLLRAIDELGDLKESDIIREEEGDDDDVDAKAIKAAKGARGKHKKLDLAIKALKSISTEMKSLARKYSAGDEAEKERIKDILRTKTPQKKELESLVAKLEKDVV
jgi:hypothetical protein|tara:strand:+ start:1070 stop:1534 length:465 start_codon:yes stop_codon:yes gene_type:complete